MFHRSLPQPYFPNQPFVDGWWLGPLFQFGFWVILIVAAVLVVRWLLQAWQTRPGSTRPRALEELEVRYARGEIGRTEYFERRADLGGGPAPREPSPSAPPKP